MDLLPRIGGVDPYHGGSPQQQRPGTGAFARKKKEEEDRRKREAEVADEYTDFEVDPLLAEIDRLRALDPALTDSGAHRALMAVRAYQKSPGEVSFTEGEDPFAGVPEAPPAADAAAAVVERITTRGFVRRPVTPPATPPDPTTSSDPARP